MHIAPVRLRLVRLFSVIFLLAGLFVLIQAACTRSQPMVRIAGSTSVQPLVEVLAEAYARQGGGRVTIQGGGSTAGLQALQTGVATLGAISRQLTPEESVRGLQPHIIGYDLLVVAVHPSSPLRGLSRAQLRQVFAGEIRDWTELGGRPGQIHLFSREAGSGSREAFRELVGPVSPQALIQNSSGAIRMAVMNDPQAIGYVSLGSALQGGLKLLRIDGKAPLDGRAPADGKAHTGSQARPESKSSTNGKAAGAPAGGYPLVRPLSLVTHGSPSGEVARFLRFVLSPEGQRLVREEGLLPAHE